MQIVLPGERFEDALFCAAFHEHSLQPLPARHAVEFRQCGLERCLRRVVVELALEEFGDVARPPARCVAEFGEVDGSAGAVVHGSKLAAGKLRGRLDELFAEAIQDFRVAARLRKCSFSFGDSAREIGAQFLQHRGVRRLQRGEAGDEAARVHQLFCGGGKIERSGRSFQHSQPAGDTDFSSGFHRGIGELHRLRGIDGHDQACQCADDFAVMEHRSAQHQHD